MTTIRVVTDEQLGVLARRQNDLFRRVREGTLPADRVITGLQDLIEGHFDAITRGEWKLIDCDAAPWCPNGWEVKPEDQIASRVRGELEFNPARIAFFLAEAQKTGAVVGNDLKRELEGKPVLLANVLDHLLANTGLIPESWKVDEQGRTRYIVFWGTIYRDSGGVLCVRYLCWGVGRWFWSADRLDFGFIAQNPSAILAS